MGKKKLKNKKHKKSVYILGIGGLAHDASVCLMRDGKVVAAANEERFTRNKHQGGMPFKAMDWCFNYADITLKDIDYVGFYYTWKQQWDLMLNHIRYFHTAPRFVRTKLFRLLTKLGNTMYSVHGNFRMFKPKRFFKIHHDIAHAASAYFNSPYDDAAVISVDLGNIAIFHGKDNKIKLVKRIKYPPVRIGMFYTLATQYLGFRGGSDEYKVMGLSAYGKPEFYSKLKDMFTLTKDGFEFDASYFNSPLGKTGFSEKFKSIVGKERHPDDPVEDRHADFAATIQKIFEEVMLHTAEIAHRLTNSKNVCLCGGAALNCVANGRILRESKFKNVFVPPGVADAGISEGIVYYIWNQILDKPKKNIKVTEYNPYLGQGYTNDEIKKDLEKCKVKYKFLNDDSLFKTAAKFIAKGKIVGWFQGRTEWGARALGNRSILADPTNPKMKDIVNKAIKYREEFRPFAPSVLEEKATEYFDITTPSPFMSVVFNVNKDKRKIIPAITHLDGTARPQTVNKQSNERYWKVIKEFEKIKGVSLVLNTSFNVKGEPIVNSPRDAIRCFFSTGIDYLVIGNYLVTKN